MHYIDIHRVRSFHIMNYDGIKWFDSTTALGVRKPYMFNEYVWVTGSLLLYLERKQINVSFRSAQTWETSGLPTIGLSRNGFVVVEIFFS